MFSLAGHCRTPNSGGSCQLLTRKKRRGIIEKRRRDRINTSLTELRRLVPTALEKQGSAKLEKAEILQMTVDHLKMLHAKGVDAFTFDPHKFAMDYHNMGFRECASEVARYLVAIEGVDLQDPLRLRLMSHLQCYSTQREIAAKSAAANSSWCASSGLPPPSQYPPIPAPSPQHPATSASSSPADSYASSSGLDSSPGPFRQPFPSSRTPHQASPMSLSPAPGLAIAAPHMAPNQYFGNHGFMSPTSTAASMAPSYELSQQSGSGVKPYRPWGTELAY